MKPFKTWYHVEVVDCWNQYDTFTYLADKFALKNFIKWYANYN